MPVGGGAWGPFLYLLSLILFHFQFEASPSVCLWIHVVYYVRKLVLFGWK